MLRFLVVRLLCGIMLFSGTFSVFAAPPTPPVGMPAGWLFARYFSNIIWGSLGTGACPAWQAIIGFSTGAGINYGVPVCAVPPSVWQQNGSSIYYNAGNVGIGTSSPETPLHVINEIRTSWTVNGFATVDRIGGTNKMIMYLNNGGLNFDDYGVWTRLRIERTTWNVGIGTISPWAKLDVSGNIRSSWYGAFAQWIAPALTGAPDAKIFSPSWDYIWTTTWGINYNEWTPDYIEFNNASSITSRIALDDWSAHFALWWGNVWIWTSSPWAKLDIAWSIKIADGTQWAWKVLQSDANGLASWQSISTLPSAGTAWQTFYSNGSSWVASQNIYNNGWNVWIWTASPWYKLHVAGDIYANGWWLRVSWQQGIYWESYGPGWYVQDATWLRTYNNASIWANAGTIGTNGSFSAGYGGTAWPTGWAIFAWNVWIATSAPATTLDVNGNIRAAGSPVPANWYNIQGGSVWVSTVYWYTRVCAQNASGDCSAAGGVVMGSENTNAAISLWSNGNIYASNYYYKSDSRLKKDIKILSGSLNKINQLNGYSFQWKKTNEHQIGLIAQEVERVFPEVVNEGIAWDWLEWTYKSVQYGNLVAPLIEATKELSAQNKAQQQEIDELKKQVEELKSLISQNK